ncbi:Oidioi.mRNA.OKI2018_I69.chr1.g3560.t1.cds [Oikopleura dioica]|uniref:Oidioi.mRNA.OKI2018_I69.chr1.g3560.t1.cds n=1 Tax=Oikopleura dioica TaxID=34765 RepID=A0ABN7SW89_OIKDI|nr:Oidioi.mRNA.OKI2018_I69.chr1.g3560.t1.cds [Oikopleura dioica]
MFDRLKELKDFKNETADHCFDVFKIEWKELRDADSHYRLYVFMLAILSKLPKWEGYLLAKKLIMRLLCKADTAKRTLSLELKPALGEQILSNLRGFIKKVDDEEEQSD